ncbi:MAG TPA: histidinol dehydrogenase [Planctomycetota bacterium]|nr:histidinol dehydrogenase [Planctomycetota bacterium]
MIPVARLTPEARARYVDRRGGLSGAITDTVEKILADFRKDGDGTIRKLTRKFDKADLAAFEVTAEEIAAAEKNTPQTVQVAIRAMYDSVVRYHKLDLLKSFEFQPIKGVSLGKMVIPFERAGLYVPGGLAVYPSSVVMAAAPATVAGVKQLVLCTPPTQKGTVPDAVLFAALVCGVTRVFKVGGAQAVFAMAYGTKTVPRCDVLVGPGNAYVTAAKKRVQDEVAIDFLAGPTELLVLSDGTTSPEFIAAELIAQAEHSPDTCCVLVTPSEAQAGAVAAELEAQAKKCDRQEIIRKSLTTTGALLVASSLDEAVAFTNEFGAEHLTVSTARPIEILKRIRSAGSIFLGEYSPVAIGDYGVGPNAILPTYGEACRRGGLTANSFVRQISYQLLSKEGLKAVAPTAMTLARIENLGGHLRSIEVRLGR